jgi:hypothetical protein
MGWNYNDLTAATGAPLAIFAPMGYVFDAQDTQHVVYQGYIEGQGPDGHIHELYWDGQWHHNDLTNATGAPLAFEAPWAYVFAAQGTQHVIYLGLGANGQGTDGHIHELYWDGQWHHNDLTAATGAPTTAIPPVGYAFETQRTQHVFYLSGGDIHELWWDSNGWHHNDVTVAGGAPNSLGVLTAHVFFAQGTQHIFYVRGISGGTDDHIHELWWDGNGWHDHDLTVAASAPTYGLGNLRSYVFAAQGTQHVVYLATGAVGEGGDGHVHELYWDGQWHHNDLTTAAGAPLASQPTGYVFDAQGTRFCQRSSQAIAGPSCNGYGLRR